LERKKQGMESQNPALPTFDRTRWSWITSQVTAYEPDQFAQKCAQILEHSNRETSTSCPDSNRREEHSPPTPTTSPQKIQVPGDRLPPFLDRRVIVDLSISHLCRVNSEQDGQIFLAYVGCDLRDLFPFLSQEESAYSWLFFLTAFTSSIWLNLILNFFPNKQWYQPKHLLGVSKMSRKQWSFQSIDAVRTTTFENVTLFKMLV
jgi:hypothetical protein